MAQMKRGNSNGHPKRGKAGTKQMKARNAVTFGPRGKGILARGDFQQMEKEGEEKDRILGV
jgi:hypothetical protein